MPEKKQRPTNRLANRHPNPHRSDQWFGGATLVRFPRVRSWRDLFQGHRESMGGPAFLVGIMVGTGLAVLTRRRP